MISVIIPTFNEEKYLPRLLDCLDRQTYKDFEIIVADNKSRDKTRQIAKKRGCTVVTGGLPARARNNGAKAAKGDLLLFIDADVTIDRHFLRKAFLELKEKRLEIGGCMVVPEKGKAIDRLAFGLYNSWIMATERFYPNGSGHSIFCSKKLHEKIGGFDETIILSEDMDYCKRAGRVGRFRILRSAKVTTSLRRFQHYGRWRVFWTLLRSGIYRLFKGEIRQDVFKYHFDYKK